MLLRFSDMDGVSGLHLPRFAALRSRLHGAIRALRQMPDPKLLALLYTLNCGSSDWGVKKMAGRFAFTRVM